MSIRHDHHSATATTAPAPAPVQPAPRTATPGIGRLTLTVCGIPALALTWHTGPAGTGTDGEVSTVLARAGLGIAQWCCRHNRTP